MLIVPRPYTVPVNHSTLSLETYSRPPNNPHLFHTACSLSYLRVSALLQLSGAFLNRSPLLRWVKNWEKGRRRLHSPPPTRPYYQVPPPNPPARLHHRAPTLPTQLYCWAPPTLSPVAHICIRYRAVCRQLRTPVCRISSPPPKSSA